MVLKASPRLANLAYGVRLAPLGARLPLFGVRRTPTTLWRTPAHEMQRLPPPAPKIVPARGREGSHAVLPAYPKPFGKNRSGIEIRREVGTRNKEAEEDRLGQAASFALAHPWAPAALRLRLPRSLPSSCRSSAPPPPPPFQPPKHPHPSSSSAYPRAVRQIQPCLRVSLWLRASASPSGHWLHSPPPKLSC